MRGSSSRRRFFVSSLLFLRQHANEPPVVIFIAAVIGIVVGVASVVLRLLVHAVAEALDLLFEGPSTFFAYAILPLVGILITVFLSKYLLKSHPGHGVTKVLYAITRNSGILRGVYMYASILASTFTVGFGGSVGLEAPVVLTGSSIASNVSVVSGMTHKNRMLLIACGAAAGISGIFNAPIAGTIFALEVLMTDGVFMKLVPVLVASVMAAVVAKSLIPEEHLFSFDIIGDFAGSDIPYYAFFGVCCGLISVHFVRSIYWTEERMFRIKNDWTRAWVGGGLVVLLLFLLPSLHGEGYRFIAALAEGRAEGTPVPLVNFLPHGFWMQAATMCLLVLIKPFASSLTLDAGGGGGIFAPSLFVGGVLGYLFAASMAALGLPISTANMVLMGMCGLLSGTQHAPLTAIFLIAEITGAYALFLPLMLVSSVSYSIAHYYERHSFYVRNLVFKERVKSYDKDQYVLSQMDVRAVVERDLHTTTPTQTIDELVALIKKSKRNLFPVLDEGGTLVGLVTLDDVRDLIFDEKKRKKVLVRDVMRVPEEEVDVHENMPLIMEKFEKTQSWNLPVLKEGKYFGFLSKSRILTLYRANLSDKRGGMGKKTKKSRG